MPVKHGYQPMRPPEKPVSQEKMLEILAKRTNLAAHPRADETLEIKPNQPEMLSKNELSRAPLEWGKTIWYEPGVVGCQISTCDRYRVDKCGNTYTAWRRALRRDHLNLKLGECDKAEAAQALCQSDLDTGEAHVSRT